MTNTHEFPCGTDWLNRKMYHIQNESKNRSEEELRHLETMASPLARAFFSCRPAAAVLLFALGLLVCPIAGKRDASRAFRHGNAFVDGFVSRRTPTNTNQVRW